MVALSIHLTSSGPLAARDIINKIIAHARGRGIDQATLARRVGIAPESLSRLKKSGRCRFVTVLELANAAGLSRLDFAEHSTSRGAATMAAQKLSAGRRLVISSDELVRALGAAAIGKDHRGHLCGFFEELPIESVHDVILDEGLEYQCLVSLAKEIGAEGETVEWLEEMASDSMAGAA